MTPDPARAEAERVAKALVDDLIDMIADTRDNTALYAHAADALLTREREVRRLALEEAVSLIPTNWLDSLLSGPQSALPSATAGRWGCPEIERLLTALADRLRARAQETE